MSTHAWTSDGVRLSHAVVSPIAAVHLWGIDWTCSFDGSGRVQQVSIRGQWMPARATLRDSLCDALELAYEEMPA